jgi:DNA-binding transcriptional ArsR family regulator
MRGSEPFFAEVAALMGDPARANILTALLDGRAWTAKELAFAAGVSPQTTSGHLARLTEGRLIEVTAQGRHRYFRLSGPAVVGAIEALTTLAAEAAPRYRPKTRASAALAEARTCYDHLAGRLGVAIHDALVECGSLTVTDDGYGLTPEGRALFASFGVPVDALERERRSFARPCLDWSERRPHLAGSLAAAFACRCFELRLIERLPSSRAVRLTAAGERELVLRLGAIVCQPVEPVAA